MEIGVGERWRARYGGRWEEVGRGGERWSGLGEVGIREVGGTGGERLGRGGERWGEMGEVGEMGRV
eukprot:7189537-Prymnesium_polylepis.1